MALPGLFCWSRFGTEAGQAIGQILERKEQERIENSGVFLWGIGNAIGPSVKELLRRTGQPEALFSPIRSAPREVDSRPAAVAAWAAAETLAGDSFELPEASLVTSRYDPQAPKAVHYALVCLSEEPLAISSCGEKIAFSALRNLLTGRPLGSSQVTAVVAHDPCDEAETSNAVYEVAIRARLTPPYLLRLRNPVLLPGPDGTSDWPSVVRQVWHAQMCLFRDKCSDAKPA